MSSSRRRGWRRGLLLSIGLVAVAGLVLWQASGFILVLALEKRLHDGGWPDARVERAALALPDVVFARVQLTSDGSLVAEDVRARLGRGIERIEIRRLRAEAEMTADGEWVLRGASASGGEPLPLDLLPPNGIAVAAAEILVATPVGVAAVTLSDAQVQRSDDGARLSASYALGFGTRAAENERAGGASAIEADAPSSGLRDVALDLAGHASAEIGADGGASLRFAIARGAFASSGMRIAELAGDAAVELPAGGSPSAEVTIEAAATEAAGVELGAVRIAAALEDATVRLAVTTPEPDVADVSIDGEAVLAGDARTATLSGRVLLNGAPARGLVTFGAELEAPGVDASAGPRARGQVRIDGRDLVYPGLFAQGAFALVADAAGDADGLELTPAESRVELVPEPDLVPRAARRVANGPLSVRLYAAGEDRPVVRWSFAERRAEFAGRLELRAADARIGTVMRARASGIGAVRNADGSSPVELEAEVAELVARNLPLGGLAVGADGFAGTLGYAVGQWRLAGAGTITASGDVGSVRLDGASARWAGRVTGTTERVVVTADGCVESTIGGIAAGDTKIGDVAPFCVAPGDGGVLLTYDLGEERSAFAFSIAEQPFAARLAHGERSYAVEGRWPGLEVAGEARAAGIDRLVARLSGGALTSSDARLAFTGVDGSVELRDASIASAALRVARIESLATPAPIAPVGLEIEAERTDDGLSFDAILSDDLGAFVLEASGRRLSERTSAKIRLHPVRFLSGATEVADLSPLLAEHIADASGVLELDAELAWAGGELTGGGTLRLRELGATVWGVSVAGFSTETRFTSVVPLVSAPAQTAAIERIDLGMPLEHGIAVFALDAEGRAAFERVGFELAGGRLFAEPFTVDSGSVDDIRLVLRAEDVELSHFLELSGIDGLAGTGVLSGRVPVRLTNGGIRLDEGILAAETNGVLRYTPDDLPDFLRGDDIRSRMLREVLANFHYEELSLAVSGESAEGGEQRLTLSARGANPDFLDGHPIELSFNFQGPLLGAVRSAVDLSDAAELEEIFERRETENEENSR